jgi:hypothetical protein
MPTAIVIATAMVCATQLAVLVTAIVWVRNNQHR